MKNLKVKLGFVMLVFASLVACKNNNEEGNANPSDMERGGRDGNPEMMESRGDSSGEMSDNESQDAQTGPIVKDYLQLKDALVADNKEQAAKYGENLVSLLDGFDINGYDDSEKQELTDIIEDAREHAEHIAMSDMAHQREHFDILSIDLVDMLEITGTPQKLYQVHCPMYNDNKGAIWLSSSEEVKNPYFGQKMLDCGKVQKEIN